MVDAAPRHLAGGEPADAADFILERRHRLAMRLAPPAGPRLLDFGCGTGSQTVRFAPHFRSTVAVDVNEAFLGKLMRRGQEGVLGVRYDGLRLPVGDGAVDHAVSFEVLEHVQDEAAALRELFRALRPGGTLFLSVPNRWWIFETHGADLPLLPWNRVPFFSWLPKALHDRWARARIYRRGEITAKLRKHGFEVRDSGYITAPMDVIRWRPLRGLLRGTLFRSDRTRVPFLSTAVYVVAGRPEGP